MFLDTDAPLEDAPVAPYGKDFADPANLPFWWSLGGLGLWQMARTGVAEATEHQLWDNELFDQVALMAAINDNDPEKIRAWLHDFDAIVNFGFLGEANTYAYRHPKVSLASVLDHRFGEMRDQAHAWQAAIDEDAMVFTNHPLTPPAVTDDWSDDPDPGYWTGEASMPRSAQFRRTAVHIYQPAWSEATDATLWSVFPYQPFTHAFVPQDRFDEVRQVGNWTIAAKSGGYIALWSWRTPTFKPNDPGVSTRTFTEPYDLVAEGGPDNVWIVEVGNDDDAGRGGGDFDSFVAAVTADEPVVGRTTEGFDVAWTSPSSGAVEFSSTGSFVVAGDEQPLDGHPRHESPWGIVEHESPVYDLTDDAHGWTLDFDAATRTRVVSAAPVRFAVIGSDHPHLFELVQGLVTAGANAAAHAPAGGLVEAYTRWQTESEEGRADDILADDSIALVVLAGVPSQRAAVAIAALRAGKHVLSDKPGVTTSAQLAEIRSAIAGRCGRPWTVLFSERFGNRAIGAAVELAGQGAIGRVVHVMGAGPHLLNAERRPDWFWDDASTGGILVDIGSHQADQFLAVAVGADGSPGEVRRASVGNVACPDHPAMQDIGSMTLVANGVVGDHRVDYLTADGLGTWGDVRLTIVGTDGVIEARANVDVAGQPGGEHLLIVDAEGTRRIDVSQRRVDWAELLLADLADAGERLMPQTHVFAVCDLVLRAQHAATRWGE